MPSQAKKVFWRQRKCRGRWFSYDYSHNAYKTGNGMDEVIYEEFKGTGNMEVHLEGWRKRFIHL